MKRKLLITILVLVTVLSLSACGKDNVGPSVNNTTGTNAEVNEDSSIADGESGASIAGSEETDTEEDINSTTIANFETLTKDEEKKILKYHTAIIIEAIKKLDVDTLKQYIEPENIERVEQSINKIKSNQSDVDFWNNTVGTIFYLEESDILLMKSHEYTYGNWYTDCWKNNETIPADDSVDFSNEYLDMIYEKYYKDAPYVAYYNVANDFAVDINDEGKVTFNPIFIYSNYECIVDCLMDTDINMRASVLLNEVDCLDLGYDYIKDDNEHFQLFLDKDLDGIVSKGIEMGVVDTEKIGTIYSNNFRDENMKNVVKQFLNDNCTVVRDLSNIYIIAPANINNTFPLNALKGSDRDKLKEMGIEIITILSVLKFNEDDNDFVLLMDLSNLVIEHGLAERKYIYAE